jgi:hypothetical protein
MSKATIAKIPLFVICVASTMIVLHGCSHAPGGGERSVTALRYAKPVLIGKIASPEIAESSGLAASRCHEGLLWTHNDSGGGPVVFALSADGKLIGRWRVPNASNLDWEDIASVQDAAGKCHIYIGDIGDNKLSRSEYKIYRIAEPDVSSSGGETQRAEILTFRYRDGNHNAEALAVHPISGTIYVITKKVSGPAGVYSIEPAFDGSTPLSAVEVAKLSLPAIPNGTVTGADISPDGMSVVVCDYGRAYELVLTPGGEFTAMWKQEVLTIELLPRSTGESIAYAADGKAIFAGSEGRNSPLIKVELK